MKLTAFIDTQESGVELHFDAFTFSGGEEHIRINTDITAVQRIEIFARLVSSRDTLRLLMAVDALRRLFASDVKIELTTPYFPYARQDRVCHRGEALGAAVMAGLINGLNFSKVTIWDAHSDVTPALLTNVVNVPQADLVSRHYELADKLFAGQLTLIAPDAGAAKKVRQLAQHFGGAAVVPAEKGRDPQSGEITHTALFGDVAGQDVLIVDDICDGGRTFIELAKVLRQQGCRSISLYVTHGIFSQGLAVFDGLIDAIYTSRSCQTGPTDSELLQIA